MINNFMTAEINLSFDIVILHQNFYFHSEKVSNLVNCTIAELLWLYVCSPRCGTVTKNLSSDKVYLIVYYFVKLLE